VETKTTMTRLHDENGMVHDGPINTARFILSCPVLSFPFVVVLAVGGGGGGGGGVLSL